MNAVAAGARGAVTMAAGRGAAGDTAAAVPRTARPGAGAGAGAAWDRPDAACGSGQDEHQQRK